MQAFWWFEEQLIAGMARPGFNQAHWLNLPFDQAVLLGWLGLHASGSAPIIELQQRIRDYCPKIAQFHGLDQVAAEQYTKNLLDPQSIRDVLKNIAATSNVLSDFEVSEDQVHFEFNPQQLEKEIAHLQRAGISQIISLTEQQHSRDVLQQHFELHHFAVDDLAPPRLEQVQQVAVLIDQAKTKQHVIAVHCLAGMGRTSTMIVGAQILLGASFQDMKSKIAKKNPGYKLTGHQVEFLCSLSMRHRKGFYKNRAL